MKMIYRHCLPTLKIGQFHRLLKKIEPNQKLALAQMSIEGEGCAIKVNPTLFCAQTGELSIEIKWQDKDGKDCTQTFKVSRIEIKGKYAKVQRYFFEFGENKFCNLYYHDGKFQNGKEFNLHYKLEGKLKDKYYICQIQKGSPYRKYGRRYKLGKLTKYGRKCVRYEIAQLKLIKSLYGELTKTQEENLKNLSEMIKSVSKEKKK